MGQTFKPDDISDILADMNRRLENLETGGKPIADISESASGSTTISAGGTAIFTVSLKWSDDDATDQPHGVPYWDLYVDNDGNSSYKWGTGGSVDIDTHEVHWWMDKIALESNTARSHMYLRVTNNDGSSHTYYLDTRWSYTTGSSSSSGS